jgi:peptide/nickel transport system permease protein
MCCMLPQIRVSARIDLPHSATMTRTVWRRLWARRSARGAITLLAVLGTLAALAPVIAPYHPDEQRNIVTLKRQPPSPAHPFGTDQFSRDVLSRVLYGGRLSLAVALLAVALSATIATSYGAIAGFYGGWIDAVMMRALDALLSIPRVLLVIAAAVLWGPLRLPELVLLLGATGWFGVSRLVRAEVLSVVRRDYVTAARALGASDHRLLLTHVLPNVITPVIVAAALGVGNVIVLEAGLSYLGAGVREPQASWGNIIRAGTTDFGALWWMSVFPGIAIVATVLACNALADALRDALDPRQLPAND